MAIVFYFKIFLLAFWITFSCIFSLFKKTFLQKDLNLNKSFGNIFSIGALKICKVKLYIEGEEILEKSQPCLYVSNHQSFLDLAIYGSICPKNMGLIGKKELKKIPVFGYFYAKAGNVMIDRSKSKNAIGKLDQVVNEMKRTGISVWIFPEGTRNTSEESLLPFKKGGFHMAIKAKVPIVIVTVSSTRKIIDWKRKKINGQTVRVKILKPFSTKDYSENNVEQLKNDVYEKMLKTFNEIN